MFADMADRAPTGRVVRYRLRHPATDLARTGVQSKITPEPVGHASIATVIGTDSHAIQACSKSPRGVSTLRFAVPTRDVAWQPGGDWL
jgi:hypothetical protein